MKFNGPGRLARPWLLAAAAVLAVPTVASAGLIGISYDFQTRKNELRTVDPATGKTTVLSSFQFNSGGWVAETFTVDPVAGRVYAQGGWSDLHSFDLATGQHLGWIQAPQTYQALRAQADGWLAGVTFNHATQVNELHRVDPVTGQSVLLSSFVFQSGFWNPNTMALDLVAGRAYFGGGAGDLLQLYLPSGQYAATVFPPPMQGIRPDGQGQLAGMIFDPQSGKNSLLRIDPSTGLTTRIASFAFLSGGWVATTLATLSDGSTAYAMGGFGDLVSIDLQSGQTNSVDLDTVMQTLAEYPRTSAVPEPQTAPLLLAAFALLVGVRSRRT